MLLQRFKQSSCSSERLECRQEDTGGGFWSSLRHITPKTTRSNSRHNTRKPSRDLNTPFQPDQDDCELIGRLASQKSFTGSQNDSGSIGNVLRQRQRYKKIHQLSESLDSIIDDMEKEIMHEVTTVLSRYRTRHMPDTLPGASLQARSERHFSRGASMAEAMKTLTNSSPPDAEWAEQRSRDKIHAVVENDMRLFANMDSTNGQCKGKVSRKMVSVLSAAHDKAKESGSNTDPRKICSDTFQDLDKESKENSVQILDALGGSDLITTSSDINSSLQLSKDLGEAPEAVSSSLKLLPFWRNARSKSDAPNTFVTRTSVLGSAAKGNSLHLARSKGLKSYSFQFKHFNKIASLFVGCANPRGNPRICWEFVAAMLILHDLVMIPLQVFIYWPGFSGYFAAIQASYWTLDIPCSFFVRFYERGVLQNGIKQTALHYIKTWFFLDLLIVAFDWISLGLDFTRDSDQSLVRAGQTVRLFRFARLLRVVRLHTYFSQLIERINSEYVWTGTRVLRFITLLVLFNHFLACGWYGLANSSDSWETRAFSMQDEFSYKYFTSLHWSLTQFTPASMEVVPTNTQERVYAVVVIIIAMVLFSSFISAITEAMAHIRRISNSKDVKNAALRRYFCDHKVSTHLAARIWRYLEESVKARQLRKMWHEVALLKELPNSLQKELQVEVYSVILTRHPFLNNYNDESPHGMMALCHHGIEEVSLVEGQDLFHAGEMARGMYFLVEGSMLYCRQNCNSPIMSGHSFTSGFATWETSLGSDSPLPVVAVRPENWMCEAPLFIEWFHVGSMVARRVSLILSMDVESVHKIFLQYSDTLRPCCRYAELFVEWLIENNADASDIFIDFDKQLDMAHQAFSQEELGQLQSPLAKQRSGKLQGSGLSSVYPESVAT